MASQAQLDANRRYRENHIERVVVEVRKGMKDYYKESAAMLDIGLMELFRRGADEYIANHPVIDKGE